MRFKSGECKRYYQYGTVEIEIPRKLPHWERDWEFSWSYEDHGSKRCPKVINVEGRERDWRLTLEVRRKIPKGASKRKKMAKKEEQIQASGRFAFLEINS